MRWRRHFREETQGPHRPRLVLLIFWDCYPSCLLHSLVLHFTRRSAYVYWSTPHPPWSSSWARLPTCSRFSCCESIWGLCLLVLYSSLTLNSSSILEALHWDTFAAGPLTWWSTWSICCADFHSLIKSYSTTLCSALSSSSNCWIIRFGLSLRSWSRPSPSWNAFWPGIGPCAVKRHAEHSHQQAMLLSAFLLPSSRWDRAWWLISYT